MSGDWAQTAGPGEGGGQAGAGAVLLMSWAASTAWPRMCGRQRSPNEFHVFSLNNLVATRCLCLENVFLSN
jgi:hypothetical protein